MPAHSLETTPMESQPTVGQMARVRWDILNPLEHILPLKVVPKILFLLFVLFTL